MFGFNFSPKDWDRVQVLNAINEAYENKQMFRTSNGDIFYQGTTSQGIKIKIYLDGNEKITTAFPIRRSGER
ncbi:EndoU domain-containing protein [Priestia koreensis]|uniref:EndoU domain-containing protein n=1 Tax=Priestia koreensis TaxID=284581 RepID=UPI003EB9AF32